MKRPRDLADRSRDLSKLKDDGFLPETFTLRASRRAKF
jgi:hypothetical protein